MSFVREDGNFITNDYDSSIQVKSAATWVTEDETIPDPVIKRCLNQFVVVRPFGLSNKMKTSGGTQFYLPDSHVEKQEQLLTYGRVVAVGEHAGKRDGVSRVEVGDTVLFPKHGGSRLTIQGVKVVFMYDDSLLAVLNPEDISLSTSL